MNIEFPAGSAGIHPATAAVAKLLQFYQINNPFTGEPYSEAFLLGLGGGLDTACILFQFKQLPHPLLILGFSNYWNNPRTFLEHLGARLSLKMNWQEFNDAKAAEMALQGSLKAGQPAILWVDKACLPYQNLPKASKGYTNHLVTVYGRDARLWRLYLDDLSSQLFEVREKQVTEGRGSLPQNNFLMLTATPGSDIPARALRGAILTGIQDNVAQLTSPIKTSGLSALELWAERLSSAAKPLGWKTIFIENTDLYSVLKSIYASIKLEGSDGFALRRLYSDFLHETASYLGNPAFNAVAGQYLQLSNHWASLAENALPSRFPPFDNLKSVLNKRAQAYRTHNLKVLAKCEKELNALDQQILAEFPMTHEEIQDVFNRLSSQVKLIAELELSAAIRLRDLV